MNAQIALHEFSKNVNCKEMEQKVIGWVSGAVGDTAQVTDEQMYLIQLAVFSAAHSSNNAELMTLTLGIVTFIKSCSK